MMRKISLFLICAAVLTAVVSLPHMVFAQSDDPKLISISFKNAAIDSEFSPDVLEYTVTLDDNTITPTLESYSIKGDAEIFIDYNFNNADNPTGITATLQYDTGSRIYNFEYSNPAEYKINSNNCLSAIYCSYGEISPEINDKDTAYKLYIPYDLKDFCITPVAQDINAHCTSANILLNEGQETELTVFCTASDGSAREYLIKIKRVDKTLQQVKAELAAGNDSFVDGTLLYQRPEFLITVCSAAAGVAVIAVLFAATKRITANLYDKDEKPFYSSVE